MALFDDVRQAWLGLRNAPGFLTVSVLVLTLGLGATIFMYGVISTLVLTPPPFPDAHRLYSVRPADHGDEDKEVGLSYLDYLEYKRRQRSFSPLTAFYTGTMSLSGSGFSERYSGGFVDHEFLDVLGIKLLHGRDFMPGDDSPTAPPVVILSHALWKARFQGDPGVLGRKVRINSAWRTIIGVTPPGFDFPRESLWIPLAVDTNLARRGDPHSPTVQLLGRLRDGVTRADAESELERIAAELAREFPQTNAGRTMQVLPLATLTIGVDGMRLLYMIFGAVWLVLLVACANVASLIFVRANFRVYEAGVRVALGARRPRLVAQMLAESVIVSLIGLAGGLALAVVGLHVIDTVLQSALHERPASWWRFSIDARVAAFASAIALFTGLLAGIGPALRASRPNVMSILRDGGRTGTGLRLSRFATVMVIAQVCMSAVVLTAAGLLTRNAVNSTQAELGVDISGIMSARVALPDGKYSHEEQGRFFERLVAVLQARPGVQRAAASSAMPGGDSGLGAYAVEGEAYPDRADKPRGQQINIVPGFFAAFDRPILRGRDFSLEDRADTMPVAIVNEAFVRAHFAKRSPLGARVRATPDDPNAPWLTIIGIAPDMQHQLQWAPDGGAMPAIYRPIGQSPARFLTVAVKGDAAADTYGQMIRETVHTLDPDLAVYWIRSLEEQQTVVRGGRRVLAGMLVAFAAISVVLAAIGIYGVLAFATGQRNREIGVRRAIGASNRQILLIVMRAAAIQLAAGLGLGALLAPAAGRLLGASLLGMRPDDPVVYGVVFAPIMVAALVASWVPALRALRIQPAAALRYE